MTPDLMLMEARIRKELSQLDKLEEELKEVSSISGVKVESVRLRAHASILHDFYSGIEKIFLAIAREVDQTVPVSEGWHRELLEQMTLDIPTKRPAVLDTELAAHIQLYLSFRHRFRNLYGYELDWSKMEELTNNISPTLRNLKNSINNFLEVLSNIAN